MNKTVIPVKKLQKMIDSETIKWLMELSNFKIARSGGSELKTNETYIYIASACYRLGGENRIQPFAQFGFFHIKKIYNAFFCQSEDTMNNDIAVDVQAEYWKLKRESGAFMRCFYYEDFEDFLLELKSFILDELYPCITNYPTPESILELYWDTDFHDKHTFSLVDTHWAGRATGLILARLHGKKGDYERMKDKCSPFMRDELNTIGMVSRTQRLIDYLNQGELGELPPGIPDDEL